MGAIEILGAEPDAEADGKYVFDLHPSPRFQWASGKKLPMSQGRNPARILSGQALRELLDSDPR